MLRFLIPNGSLAERLMMYLGITGFPVGKPDRTGFCGVVNGIQFSQLDRRMVPAFIDCGAYDAGITGYDLWLNSGVQNLQSYAEICFSRATDKPTRWVLACRKGYVPSPEYVVRIGCELPDLARILMRRAGLAFPYRLMKIEGSEEQSVVSGMVDMVLVVTETGSSIAACGLEIVPGCEELLVSTPRILVGQGLTAEQENALTGLSLALQAVVGAQAFVMVAFDFPSTVDISSLGLPSAVAPTVSPLLPPSLWNACEICIARADFGPLLPRLKAAGARGIVLREVQGYLS